MGISIAIAIFSILISSSVLGIRINEVMPHTNNSLGNEWIELYNPTNENINLTNWKINDTQGDDYINLTISNFSYALIVDDSISFNGSYGCKATYLLLNNSNISCFEVAEIGRYGLNDEGECIFLYNETGDLISNFSWTTNIKSSGKSWSFNGTDWQTCMPTPGYENNCTILQNTTNQTTPPPDPDETYIEIDYDEEVRNGEEFEVEINAYDLDDEDYDIKVYITPKDNSEIISETYNEADDNWKSSNYYINEIISGPGDESVTLKVRINKDFDNFYGAAKIYAKIRDSRGSVVDSVEGEIEILEKEADNSGSTTSAITTTPTLTIASNSSNISGITGNVIRLNSKKQENIKMSDGKILYKSRQEYFKEYGIYAFALVCLIIIVVLLIKH